MAHAVIQVSGIRKVYGKTVAVDDVSFEVHDGEIFGLIGPNGAGKTTTMECVEGLRRPDRGTISVLGLDPFRDVYQLQDRIGVQLQQAQLQKRIKVWEAVAPVGVALPEARDDGDRLLEQLGLADKRNAWFMTLSGGQKQRLFIALALINDPRGGVSRRADDRPRSAGAARHLGAGPRHPRARQDRVPDHAPDGGSGAAVRPRGDHRARPDHRHRHAGSGLVDRHCPESHRGARDRGRRRPRSAFSAIAERRGGDARRQPVHDPRPRRRAS